MPRKRNSKAGEVITASLAYGRGRLPIRLPADQSIVIEPTFLPGLSDEGTAIEEAVKGPLEGAPLRELVSPSSRVAIAVCDVTRPVPTARILPFVLRSLNHVPREQILILVATGTHRACTPGELEEMLGEEVLRHYRVLNHVATDERDLERAGETSRGTPIRLNRQWLDADFRLTLGFVEPHFFAGFSGGAKLVAPGLAGLETVMGLHSAELIADSGSTWGEMDRNPIQAEIGEIAAMTGIDFTLDVTLNRDRRVTGVFAGPTKAAHRRACEFVRNTAMQPVEGPFDLVVTTNSGYPLDLNLYQTIKGISAAARIVRDGGTILCASECSDGIPEHGRYGRLLASEAAPQDLLKKIMTPGFSCPDQWQVQIQAQVQQRANLLLKSSGLTDQQIAAAHMEPVEDLELAVQERLKSLGPESRICVLPEGPQTIPYLV